jgi:hypothetical protein
MIGTSLCIVSPVFTMRWKKKNTNEFCWSDEMRFNPMTVYERTLCSRNIISTICRTVARRMHKNIVNCGSPNEIKSTQNEY